MSRLNEVIKTLVEQAINIDVKIQILIALDNNRSLINSVIIDERYKFAEFKILLEIQNREYCIIQICSFMDEYNKYFTPTYVEDEYATRVRELRKFLKPFFNEINRNYNLKDYRNHILAHSHRRNSESILMGAVNKTYQFPKSTEEFISLKTIIDLVLKTIFSEFKDNFERNLFEDKIINSGKIILDRNKKEFNLQGLYDRFNSKLRN